MAAETLVPPPPTKKRCFLLGIFKKGGGRGQPESKSMGVVFISLIFGLSVGQYLRGVAEDIPKVMG